MNKFETVLSRVSNIFNLSPNEIMNGGRKKRNVMARAMMVTILHDVLGFSYNRISRAMGFECHTSSMHLHGVFKNRERKYVPDYKNDCLVEVF